jgi:hypothetical protein
VLNEGMGGGVIVWDIETVLTLGGLLLPMGMRARAMTRYARRSATSFRSPSITRSFVLARWLLDRRMGTG